MAEKIKINDRIFYIRASENPLSADIGIVEGDDFVWLFDLGNNEDSVTFLNNIEKPKNAVISHFHPDHMGNIDKTELNRIFLGANTFRYTNRGTIVDKDYFFDDGVKLHVFPLPSSHAKGSVGFEAEKYAFLGDATYATMKSGKVCYNASVLKEEIAVLKSLSADFFLLSHDEKFVHRKEEIISELEEIYSKRDPKESYIFL